MQQHFILVIAASTLHLLLGHCNCLLLGYLWAQHLCYFRQGSTWTNTAPTRFNVGLLVEAGDGGGGAPVPIGCSRTSLVFFYCLGDVGEAARWYFYSLAGDRPGTLGADRHCRWREVLCCGCCFVDGGSGARWGMQKLRHTPHALPITCGRRAAVEGREGSGRLRLKRSRHRP